MSNLYNLELNLDNYPMLTALKKKDLNKLILNIFETGYKLYFPNKNELIKKNEFDEIKTSIDYLRKEIEESDITDIGDLIVNKINEKIEPLNNSLTKLLGLQNASCKKGELGENIIQHTFTTKYSDIIYEDKSACPHCGDAWLYLPSQGTMGKKKIMIESKNYQTTVGSSEINKAEYDMKFNNIRFCLFVSINAAVQGFRDMDLHTFFHNNESYFILIISNLSNNISKLDLGYCMLKKLMELFDNNIKFNWIKDKIKDNLNRVNDIINKNYILRDHFYVLEKSINNSLDLYHKELRDYQYELEHSIKKMTEEINSTMNESKKEIANIKEIIEEYKEKKIYQVLGDLEGLIIRKKWKLYENNENTYNLKNKKDVDLFELIIQTKKAIIKSNNMEFIFTPNNNKQNLQNIKFIETNF